MEKGDTLHKDVRRLIGQLALIEGVTVDERSSHPRVYKNGVFVTALPGTPSDSKWYPNTLSALKRAGIDLNAPREREKVATSGGVMKEALGPVITPAPALGVRKGRGGVPGISPEAVPALRKEMQTFLAQNFDGVKARFARYLFDFGAQYEGRSFKTFASAEMVISRFINGDTDGVSVWAGQLIQDAMKAYRAGERPKPAKAPRSRKQMAKQKTKLVAAPAPAGAPEPAKVAVTPEPQRVVMNGTLDHFLSLIEFRALTRDQLLEALSLAEMNAEFASAHPRS